MTSYKLKYTLDYAKMEDTEAIGDIGNQVHLQVIRLHMICQWKPRWPVGCKINRICVSKG